MNYRGLNIPFTSFGNVTSDDLFADKEQAVFDFYAANAGRYKNALDIGANIGVHSILMARNGWQVKAFEPDPEHHRLALANILNHDANVQLRWAAVSDRGGTTAFTRVKGNTTGSHIKGDKSPYGELDEFTVPMVDCRPLFDWADFAKIDCEGHEARLLCTVTPEQAAHLDCIVEVGNETNAAIIYTHCISIGWNMYAQQSGWQEITAQSEMPCEFPTHHSHGALFLTCSNNWRYQP